MINLLLFLLCLPFALIGIILLPVALALLIPIKLLSIILEALFQIAKAMALMPMHIFDNTDKLGSSEQEKTK